MSEFDHARPALVHDRLCDQVFAWEPERHGRNYRTYRYDLGDGVIAWDGLLLDGWRPPSSAATA